MTLTQKLVLFLIKKYQHTKLFRHELLRVLFLTDGACRFRPTCSQYTYEAVAKYGTIKGILLGFRRILKCHPWSKGGHDPLV